MIKPSFEKSLKKGRVGEEYVRGLLEKKGYIVYTPKTEGAHAFDFLAIKEKEKCIALDVKSKARRNKYKDTGVNLKHYRIYEAFMKRHNMPFWLIFVDEMEKKIYGNTIEALMADKKEEFGINYPYIWKRKPDDKDGTIYWHLDSMIQMGCLECEAQELLCVLSQRNHEYRETKS